MPRKHELRALAGHLDKSLLLLLVLAFALFDPFLVRPTRGDVRRCEVIAHEAAQGLLIAKIVLTRTPRGGPR